MWEFQNLDFKSNSDFFLSEFANVRAQMWHNSSSVIFKRNRCYDWFSLLHFSKAHSRKLWVYPEIKKLAASTCLSRFPTFEGSEYSYTSDSPLLSQRAEQEWSDQFLLVKFNPSGTVPIWAPMRPSGWQRAVFCGGRPQCAAKSCWFLSH